MAGIGCHGMAIWMPERRTSLISHMGGEGVSWIGQAPFSADKHIFQNLGDGTYYHSGLMAIRQAAAAGVNITYKILFNDAVAMTGGQPHDGPLNVPDITKQVAAEGAKQVVVVTDEPDKYPLNADFAAWRHHPPPRRARRRAARAARDPRPHRAGLRPDLRRREAPAPQARHLPRSRQARVHQRRGLRGLRRLLRQEQLRVGEAARDRARPQAPDRPEQLQQGLLLRERLLPELRLGAWRHARKARRPQLKVVQDDPFAALPMPTLRPLSEAYGILVTGIGGTGVITVGALIGMAAHLEGKGCTVLDFTGLAQKNGAVMSHVRLAPKPEDLHAVRIAAGGANLVLGCDMVVAASPAALSRIEQGVTKAVINGHVQPVAAFVMNGDMDLGAEAMMKSIRDAAGDEATSFVDGTGLATAILGDSIATNLFMLGYAWQKGLLPLSLDAHRARHRAERRGGRGQQAHLRLGPPRGAQPRRGAGRRQADAAGREAGGAHACRRSSPSGSSC